MIEQFRQADGNSAGRQASVDFLEGDVDVGHAKDETDRFVADFGNESELRHDELFQLLRHELKFLFGKRNEAPVIFPGVVIDLAHARRFRVEVLQVPGTDRDGMPFLERGGEPSQTLRGAFRFRKPPGIEICDLYFRYSEGTPDVLSGLNLTIPSGQSIQTHSPRDGTPG